MAKKNTTDEKKVFNFLSESPVIKQTEEKVIKEYDRLEQEENKVEETIHPAPNPAPDMGGENRGGKFDNEPTKGVQANMPISLYNRMKQLKFNTDQTFQSMFQEAMDLWLDVQEGKMKVSKVE